MEVEKPVMSFTDKFKEALAAIQFMQHGCSTLLNHMHWCETDFMDTGKRVLREALAEHRQFKFTRPNAFTIFFDEVFKNSSDKLTETDLANLFFSLFLVTVDFFKKYDKYVGSLQVYSKYAPGSPFLSSLDQFGSSVAAYQPHCEGYVNQILDIARKHSSVASLKAIMPEDPPNERMGHLCETAESLLSGTMAKFTVKREQSTFYQEIALKHWLTTCLNT